MGMGAILSLDEAAELLPIADGEARRWLIDAGCVRDLNGRKTVSWLRVIEAWDSLPLCSTKAPRPGLRVFPPTEPLPRVALGTRARKARRDGGSGPSHGSE